MSKLEISPAMIMRLLPTNSLNWRDSIDSYFRHLSPWIRLVHQDVFLRKIDRLGRDGVPQDPGLRF